MYLLHFLNVSIHYLYISIHFHLFKFLAKQKSSPYVWWSICFKICQMGEAVWQHDSNSFCRMCDSFWGGHWAADSVCTTYYFLLARQAWLSTDWYDSKCAIWKCRTVVLSKNCLTVNLSDCHDVELWDFCTVGQPKYLTCSPCWIPASETSMKTNIQGIREQTASGASPPVLPTHSGSSPKIQRKIQGFSCLCPFTSIQTFWTYTTHFTG